HDHTHPEMLTEGLAEELRFLLPHQPVVDVDAGEAVADGSMDQCRRDRGIDATGEGADHETIGAGRSSVRIDTVADLRHGLLDEALRRPGRRRAGDSEDEVPEDVAATRRVDDLRVELDAIEVAVGRGEAGKP